MSVCRKEPRTRLTYRPSKHLEKKQDVQFSFVFKDTFKSCFSREREKTQRCLPAVVS